MIKILTTLVFVTLIAFVTTWFIENDGSVIVEWMGYRIQTSVAFAILASVVAMVIFAMLLQLILFIKHYPTRYRKKMLEKRRDKGLTALTEGFAAVAAGDARGAKKLSNRATVNLGSIPLTRLLSAQTAQLEGDRDQAQVHYNAMMEHKETEIIAIKGLLIEARKDGDLEKAKFLAEKAYQTKPDVDWAVSILIDIYQRLRDWENAETMVQRALKKKFIPSNTGKRTLGIIYLAKAMEAQSIGNRAAALKHAQKSYKALPHTTPAVNVYAQLLIEDGQQRKATKIIENEWRFQPHPDLGNLYMSQYTDDKDQKRIQRAEKLFHLNPDHVESMIVVARTAITVRDFDLAHRYLDMAISTHETRTALRLMAELSRLEQADNETVNRWQNRAQTAPQDHMWVCHKCHYVQPKWHVQCQNCHSFDSLSWSDQSPQAPEVGPNVSLIDQTN